MTHSTASVVPPQPDRLQERVWYVIVLIALVAAAWFLACLDWPLIWQAWPLLLQGLGVSFALTGVSIMGGLVLGAALAAGRLSRFAVARYLSLAFIETVRATPQLMVIFWIYFTYPAAAGHAMDAWTGAAVHLKLTKSERILSRIQLASAERFRSWRGSQKLLAVNGSRGIFEALR